MLPLSQSSVEIGLSLQLLLACARLELNLPQQERVRYLCGQIDDWQGLVKMAEEDHRFLPLVYRHLRFIAPESIPADTWMLMRESCRRCVMQTVGMVAEQHRLVKKVFDPLEVPYAFFKGPTLGYRYYGSFGLRQCRDIDVLVHPDRLFDVVTYLVDLSYQLDLEVESLQEMEFACRYANGAISAVSPMGHLIELHPRLSRKGHIFPTRTLLKKAKKVDHDGFICNVLPTTALFVYLCYHHSRHQWARLHWLTDLDALQRHAKFDLQAVLSYARKMGLETTVRASLQLHHACGQQNPHNLFLPDAKAQAMLETCLKSIPPGKGNEKDLATKDFRFVWQTNLKYFLALWVAQLRPTLADYRANQLPKKLYIFYYLLRPFRLIMNGFFKKSMN